LERKTIGGSFLYTSRVKTHLSLKSQDVSYIV